MTKKSFVVILILSVVTTYGTALADFSLGISKNEIGLPFGFSRLNFLGAETENAMLFLDIIFWFLIIWGIWKVLFKGFKKSKK